MNLIKLLLEFNKISREMANKTQNEDLARFLYIKLKKLVDFKTFTLGKIEKNVIHYLFYVEDDEIFEGLSKNIEPEKSLAYYAISHNEVLIINDFDKEIFSYIKEISRTGDSEVKYNSIIVYPFEINGETKGFFSVQDKEKNFFDAEKIILFREVAQYLALLYERMENTYKVKTKNAKFQLTPKSSENPIKNFINILLHQIRTIQGLIEIFCKTLEELFEIEKIEMKIFKNYSMENKKYSYYKELIEVKRIDKANKHILSLSLNESYFGELYFSKTDMNKLNDDFQLILELFILSLSNFVEKEELEYENAQKYQLMQALENSYKNLYTINETVKSITSTLDMKELGRRVYSGLKKIFQSDCAVALAYYNNVSQELEYDILIDYGQEYDLGLLKKDDTSTFAPWVVRNKSIIIINDYNKEHQKYIDIAEDFVGNTSTNSLLYLPLFKDDDIIGVFTVQKKEKNFFDNYHIELVKSIGSFVNIAMINLIEARQLSKEIEEKKKYERKLERINRKLEKISSLDSLTKLYNRRYFEKLLKEFWTRALAENKSLGFIIFDLDYFKQINDSFGHLAGDKALVEMSLIIKKYVKKDIKFGRFGGDEFVGVLFNQDKEVLFKIGKELKKSLLEKNIPCPFSPGKVLSLTMGITIFSPEKDSDINELFLKADEALYKGKVLGRNTIVFYERGNFQCLD